MLSLEIWKDIEDYEGLYQVSNLGRIRSLDRIDRIGRLIKGRVLAPCNNGKGYQYVTLAKEGQKTHEYVHRLVAKAFLDNQSNLPEVNHIDENKQNNHVSNLEWCAREENMNHGSVGKRIAEQKKGKPLKTRRKIEAFDVNTGKVIRTYEGLSEAMAEGHDSSGISICCNGKRKTYHGYGWRYVS